jgi:hypothetical protein
MQPLSTYVAALVIAVVFYAWRGYARVHARRRRVLRERVAYLLWVVADHIDPRKSSGVRRLSSG